MTEEPELDHILEKFPFSGYDDQEKRLARVLTNFAGTTQQRTEAGDMTNPSLTNIRNQFRQLSKEEKAILLEHLANVAAKMLRREARAEKAAKA